jgi:hypothetical protein
MKRRSLISREGKFGKVPEYGAPWTIEALGIEWHHWIFVIELRLNQGGYWAVLVGLGPILLLDFEIQF